MTDVIDVAGLVKRFGSTTALDGLDLSVARGEVHGFLGPNGSGKSTTIRVLLGLLRPDRGSAQLFGGDPWREAAALHRRLAYVPGDVNLWPNLSGGETIDLLGRLRGGLDAQRRGELLVALTWLAYGLAPRWAAAGWLALGFCVVVMLFGQPLRLPAWVTDLSPFSHLALAPAEPFAWTPWLILLAVAQALSAPPASSRCGVATSPDVGSSKRTGCRRRVAPPAGRSTLPPGSPQTLSPERFRRP